MKYFTERVLDELIRYYDSRRRVDHTRTITIGAKIENALIVCVFHRHGESIRREYRIDKDNIVNIENITLKLLGRNQPLVFDNYTINTLMYESRDRLRENRQLIREKAHIKELLTDSYEQQEAFVEKIKYMKFSHAVEVNCLNKNRKWLNTCTDKIVQKYRNLSLSWWVRLGRFLGLIHE